VKGVRSYQKSHPAPSEGRSFDPGVPGGRPQAAPVGGGEPAGGLGGMLGGGLGGLLSGLGGAGALGALVSHLQQKGLGPQVNSWIGTGHNQPVAPDQVANALGEDNLRQLEQQTGLPRQSLLSELSEHLPDAVNELTPQGRLPDDGELHQIAAQSAKP